jgi:hypothetical protein
MRVDGLNLTEEGPVFNTKVESGNTLPTVFEDGATFLLKVLDGSNKAGLYYALNGSWENVGSNTPSAGDVAVSGEGLAASTSGGTTTISLDFSKVSTRAYVDGLITAVQNAEATAHAATLSSAEVYADGAAEAALSSANTHSGSALTAAVSTLNGSLVSSTNLLNAAITEGDASTLAAAKSYADGKTAADLTEAVTQAATHADAGDAATLSSANSHADSGAASTLTASKAYTDTKTAAALTSAESYAEAYADEAVANAGATNVSAAVTTAVAQAATHADAGDAATLVTAKAYADSGDTTILTSANTHADAGDATTLAAAKTYADGLSSGANASVLADAAAHADSGDVATLAAAKTYADSTGSAALASAQAYADVIVQGFDLKNSVRARSIGNITLSGLQTVDGVALASGDRVFVPEQTDASKNGIYVASSGTWARAADANSSQKFNTGAMFSVEDGTLYQNTAWVLTTKNVNLGVSNLTFTTFGTSVNPDGSTIVKTNNVLSVSPSFTPYDVSIFVVGKPNAADVVARLLAVRAFNLPVNLVGSIAKVGVVATTDAVFLIKRNGSQIGYITFAAGAAGGVFTFASAVSVTVGDLLTFHTPDTQDATLADMACTLMGNLQ